MSEIEKFGVLPAINDKYHNQFISHLILNSKYSTELTWICPTGTKRHCRKYKYFQ